MTSLASHIDHIVVAAPTLDEGVAWVEEQLGVSISPRIGGEHDGKGTHNVLLSLGPSSYLEIIAVNRKPRHPPGWSWVGTVDSPRFETWLVRTTDIDAALAAATLKPGDVYSMSRGDLTWRITFTPDGSLAYDGALPALIQWQSDDPHPVTSKLPDLGLRLQKLEVRPDIIESLGAVNLKDDRILASTGQRLVVTISTPTGLRTLSRD